MDRKIAGFVFGAVVVCSIIWQVSQHSHAGSSSDVLRGNPENAGPPAKEPATTANDSPSRKPAPTLTARAQMLFDAQLRRLEQNGEVPENPEPGDWEIAQKTSWWGKRVDPKEFWKGRVVWWDDWATLAAKRHGRAYPPIPEVFLPRLKGDTNDADRVFWNSGVEGPNLHGVASSKEAAFWKWFTVSMPYPPERLALEQTRLAEDLVVGAYFSQGRGSNGKLDPSTLKWGEDRNKNDALALGCPLEAASEQALFWVYVVKKREEYQQRLARGLPPDHWYITDFVRDAVVDPKLITDPLTPEQMQAANAWKVAYLQRLRREKVDESYINAYLNAWNLSADAIFPPSAGR